MRPGRDAFLRGAHKRGEVHLSTVSGVASTKKEMVRYFDRSTPVDIITTKSFQVTPNPGNREPVICEVAPGDFGNSVGLRNPGMEAALPELEALRKEGLSKWLNVSVSASNPDDFITLVKAFDHVADSIELNFSCPHASAGFGASIGCDLGIATEYVRAIREACPGQESALWVKLTPNVDNIGEIAASVIAAGADGIVAINTVGPNLYTEPHSGAPILNNKLGGKGGASGAWVKERALKCVSEIRKAIGEDAPIIAMGGVQGAADAAALVKAGGDAVGIGSVFGTVPQQDWPAFLSSIKEDASAILAGSSTGDRALSFIRKERRMEYVPHKIQMLTKHSDEMLIMELDGKLGCRAGEFAFLWVPGIGEKPFSVAHNEPLTFLIRRRGFFTSEMFKLKEGDTVYVRGLYGKPLDAPESDEALFIAGGSGVAVAPSLCRMVQGRHTRVKVLVGTSETKKGSDGKFLFEDYLRENSSEYLCVPDDRVPGRVLTRLSDFITPGSDTCVYLVGPEKFMAIAAAKATALGVPAGKIFLSLERSTLCGIGMCGECVCGDRLTCQWGTFQSYEYILAEAPSLLE